MRPLPFAAAVLLTLAAGAATAQTAPPPLEERTCGYKPGSGKLELITVRQAYTAGGGYDGPRKVLRDGKALTAAQAGYTHAKGRAWHTENRPITLNGKTYVKPNPAEQWAQIVGSPSDLTVIGEYDGVALLKPEPDSYYEQRFGKGTIFVLYGLLNCDVEPYVPRP
ncbi:MAG: hypothetical protein Q7T61_13135 [Caulobacter sp.]|nr:hypothetical protein [Caulobacter sp.]